MRPRTVPEESIVSLQLSGPLVGELRIDISPMEIPARFLKAWKCCVGYRPDDDAVRQHAVSRKSPFSMLKNGSASQSASVE